MSIERDPLTGAEVVIIESRQKRPNLPTSGCPFCPGGLEAPDDYDVRWFENRFPAFPNDRCEIVLYTSDHAGDFESIGVDGARKVVDLWAERTQTLGSRDEISYVLVFENRGSAVGATIDHPHGQIYAFDHVPPIPTAELRHDACVLCEYRPPAEDIDAEYPIFFTSGRVVSQYLSGTQTRRIGGLVSQYPEPLCEMHPRLAETLGIKNGDLVKVSTRRGEIIVPAQVVKSIRPDTVFIPYHWPGKKSANLITHRALDPISKIPAFKVCACKIEKVADAPTKPKPPSPPVALKR